MKKIKFLFPAAVVLFAVVFLSTSLPPDRILTRQDYLPIFMERSDLEKSVFYIPEARELRHTGKIYTKDGYVYVNERYKGVHVIDNKDPHHPKIFAFINAPGCIDMAVKGNIMYLDNAVDLVAFDLNSKEVKKRIPRVFPEPSAPDGGEYRIPKRDEKYIIVGWKKTPRSK